MTMTAQPLVILECARDRSDESITDLLDRLSKSKQAIRRS
jgi:hypothetical protein